jgi:hypothetical protein
MTTVFSYGEDERIGTRRKRPSGKTLRAKPAQRFFGAESSKVIPIPTVAAAYNDQMNHVDRGD